MVLVPYFTARLHLPIRFKLAERAFQKCMVRLCSDNSEYPKSAFLGRFSKCQKRQKREKRQARSVGRDFMVQAISIHIFF